MGAKKRLIGRMATWAGFALALAAAVGLFTALADFKAEQRFEEGRKQDAGQRTEESRAYLAGLAKRIDNLPVDPALAYEIESRYFEEEPRGPFYVWAMDTQGAFVFGVPRPAFDKVNAVYDQEVTPRLKEGVFFDRQSFLLAFIDDHPSLGLGVSDDAGERASRGERWRLDRGERDGGVVLSTPLKTTTGAALGSLYLKQMAPPWRHRDDRRFQAVMIASAIVGVLSFIFLWIMLPTWVYVDARERGVRRAPLFAFLTVLSSLVGLVVYLISRPENVPTLACPGCSREVDGGTFCPHCGRDLSRSICPACRYPLHADWAYCPGCRAEVKAAAAATPVTEAGSTAPVLVSGRMPATHYRTCNLCEAHLRPRHRARGRPRALDPRRRRGRSVQPRPHLPEGRRAPGPPRRPRPPAPPDAAARVARGRRSAGTRRSTRPPTGWPPSRTGTAATRSACTRATRSPTTTALTIFGQLFLRALRTRNRFSATSVDQLPHMLASLLMFGHQLLLPVPDVDRTQLLPDARGQPARVERQPDDRARHRAAGSRRSAPAAGSSWSWTRDAPRRPRSPTSTSPSARAPTRCSCWR